MDSHGLRFRQPSFMELGDEVGSHPIDARLSDPVEKATIFITWVNPSHSRRFIPIYRITHLPVVAIIATASVTISTSSSLEHGEERK